MNDTWKVSFAFSTVSHWKICQHILLHPNLGNSYEKGILLRKWRSFNNLGVIPYHNLETGDTQSQKLKWWDLGPNPGPLAPQAKSLSTPPPLLDIQCYAKNNDIEYNTTNTTNTSILIHNMKVTDSTDSTLAIYSSIVFTHIDISMAL